MPNQSLWCSQCLTYHKHNMPHEYEFVDMVKRAVRQVTPDAEPYDELLAERNELDAELDRIRAILIDAFGRVPEGASNIDIARSAAGIIKLQRIQMGML